MTYKILVADSLSYEGVALLKAHPEFQVDVNTGLTKSDLLQVIPEYHALLVRSQTKVTSEVFRQAKMLRLVGRAGIGVDNIDVDAATKFNVLVMNAPDGNAITTAEHAIALMMSLARHIPDACQSMRAGMWEKSRFNGVEIHGKTLAIIGLGKIGRIVANLARGLRMKILAVDPVVDRDTADECGAELVPLEEALKRADFLTIHAAYNKHTKHLINERAFQQLKPGAFIIHAARGGIIDEHALIKALNNNIVQGAALDVFEQEPPLPQNPLLHHPRVIVTPHLGASTKEAQNRVATEIAGQTRDYFLKNEIRNAVNLKELKEK